MLQKPLGYNYDARWFNPSECTKSSLEPVFKDIRAWHDSLHVIPAQAGIQRHLRITQGVASVLRLSPERRIHRHGAHRCD